MCSVFYNENKPYRAFDVESIMFYETPGKRGTPDMLSFDLGEIGGYTRDLNGAVRIYFRDGKKIVIIFKKDLTIKANHEFPI